MATGKAPAFFGYARENSDMARRIAADLTQAGANVWLDKLAIRPGQRWDREVEQALDRCSEVIVMLSPTAVKSDNVRNEVAYNLREGKPVIPLIIQDCTIPLQLTRNHFIDFRVNYEDPLKVLSKALTVIGPPDLGAIARQFHEGTTRPIVIKAPIKFRTTK
jgi:hypothetical protein